jgi:hypothetical protein
MKNKFIFFLEDTPTSAEMDPTSLTLEITENFRLIRFELDAIRIIPFRSASIDITIFGDNDKQYCRTFFLCGQAYLDYETDDYLFEWVHTQRAPKASPDLSVGAGFDPPTS